LFKNKAAGESTARGSQIRWRWAESSGRHDPTREPDPGHGAGGKVLESREAHTIENYPTLPLRFPLSLRQRW